MMKRLFKVVDSKGRMLGGATDTNYFESKQEAKAVRDRINAAGENFHVSRGPDHMGKHSGFSVPRMRRQPKL